jgi:sugar phosphate isomerase/epimerase
MPRAARPTRRRFLGGAALVPLARVCPPAKASAAAGVRPWHVRLSCNLYSFNQLLRGGVMTMEAVLDLCARLGFDAVDPTGYYFPGYPAPPDDAFVNRIKRHAFRLGLDISGTGIRNDFTAAAQAARAADVALAGRWVEVAARLGAPTLRVFSGKGVPAGHTRSETTAWVVDALALCARMGAGRGVMIALQNHNDFLTTADQVIEILRRVGSDWLGVNLDVGSFTAPDPYAEIARLAPHAITWQIKERVPVAGRPVKTDLAKIARIVREARYRGYLPIEVLGPEDPRERLPRFLDEVRAALA